MAIVSTVVLGAQSATGEQPDSSVSFFSIGDSIFNYSNPNHWGYEWPLALDEYGHTSSGIDADSGRSLSSPGRVRSGLDAVAHNAAAITQSDVVITNLGVNDSERDEAWEALARTFVAELRRLNPDVAVVWITPVAEPGVAPARVVERAADHAATLRELAAEGLIDVVVDWDNYALTHPEVFHSDGVHYWVTGDAATYAGYAASAAAGVTPGNGPPPTTTPPTTVPPTTVPPTTVPPTDVAPSTSAPPTTVGTPTTVPDPLGPGSAAPLPRCGGSGLPWDFDDDPLADTIRRLYRAILDREATETELDYWSSQNAATASLESITEAILVSPEATRWSGFGSSPLEDLRIVHDHLWRRAALKSLESQWEQRISAGWSTEALVLEMVQRPAVSSELGTAAAQSTMEGAVCRIYLAGLGRSPDVEGMAHWSNQASLEEIVTAITRSPEFRLAHPASQSDEDFVSSLYFEVFGRAPDASGQAFWLEAMAQGMSRGRVLLGVSSSPEFVLRTNTVR